jgi:uncharacterized protein YdhG (YjbR/CyaY superfamily)
MVMEVGVKDESRVRKEDKGSAEVEAYLAALSPDARNTLQTLRKTISEAAPGAEEGFSYGVPAFRLDGRPLVAYSASKKYCSLYPMSGSVISAHARDLERFDTLKGTIHFSPERPLPASLVKKLVKARIAEVRKKTP